VPHKLKREQAAPRVTTPRGPAHDIPPSLQEQNPEQATPRVTAPKAPVHIDPPSRLTLSNEKRSNEMRTIRAVDRDTLLKLKRAARAQVQGTTGNGVSHPQAPAPRVPNKRKRDVESESETDLL
jgi:hypothetical protein